MKNHKNCPICEQEVFSDATKIQSCALCGMVIDDDNMVFLVEDSDSMYFCLHGCYEKYMDINKNGDAK